MKQILIVLSLLLIPLSIELKANEAPIKGVLMGSATVNDDFDNDSWSGGIKFGSLVMLDSDKGLYLRTMFTRSAYGPGSDDVESISIAVLSEWYLGEKMGFYATFGGDAYISGDLNGTDPFMGFGLSRTIWKDGDRTFTVPAQIDLFLEFTFQDGGGQETGSYNQANLGLTFSKPVK